MQALKNWFHKNRYYALIVAALVMLLNHYGQQWGWFDAEVGRMLIGVSGSLTGVTLRANTPSSGPKTYFGSLAFGVVNTLPALFGVPMEITDMIAKGVAGFTGLSFLHGQDKAKSKNGNG